MNERLNNPEAAEHFESMRDFFTHVTFSTKEEKLAALRLAESALLDDPEVYLVDASGAVRKLRESTQPISYSQIKTIGHEDGEVYLYLS